MDSAFADQIRNRVAAERARTSYPADFPALPPVPAARYCEPRFFELERERVFGRSWLLAAHEDELAGPGDAMLLDQFPAPIILVRDENGRIRAFHNACRHRGAPLLREPRARIKTRLVCQYHSWSYDLEGRLRGVPDGENFRDLDRRCLGLGAIRCETWGGMVFVNFDPAAPPLRGFLAPILRDLDREIGDVGDRPRFVRKTSSPVRCNWKLAIDANIETYHVNTVHKSTVAPVLDQKGTAIWLLANGHSRMFTAHRRPVERNAAVPRFARISPVTGEGAYAYLVFPNTVMVISPMLIFASQAWPLAPGGMRYDTFYLMAAPMDDRNQSAYERIIAATERILKEDLGNLTFIQRSIEAGAIDSIRLNYQERRIYHLHESIDRVIGSELVPPALRTAPLLDEFIED